MAKDIELKKADRDIFADQGSSWMALDLPEVKPPLYSKAFIVFVTSFLFVGVVYSGITKVPVVIESTGKLVTSKQAVPIRAHLNFTVNGVQVKENQIVKAGEMLVSSGDGLSPADLLLVKDLETGLNYINSQQPIHQCSNCATVARQVLNISKKLSKHKVAGQMLKPVLATSQVLTEVLDKQKVLDQRMEPVRTRLASLTQAGSRQPASAKAASAKEIQKLQSQIDQQYAPYRSVVQKSREILLKHSNAISTDLESLSKISGVAAPFEGKVVNIRVKGVGDMIGNGQPVLEIVPIDHQIIANIEVQNKDIGSVEIGDPVEISVDAYPEMDFGVLKGHISEILPMETMEFAGPLGLDKTFKVRVKLESQAMQARGKSHALLPGMTIRARTIKQKETLLKKLYRSLFRMKEDGRVQNS